MQFNTTRKVFCTFQLEGFHQYKDAKEDYAFLRSRHRHMFHFKVTVSVNHSDREIEFIEMKDKLIKYFSEEDRMNNKSCEMLADLAVSKVNNLYGDRISVEAEVSEDGENGAVVTQSLVSW